MTDAGGKSNLHSPADRDKALAEVAQADSVESLEKMRLHWLGRKGLLTKALRELGSLPALERAEAGKACNQLKRLLSEAFQRRETELRLCQTRSYATRDSVDIELDGRRNFPGSVHPVNDMSERIVDFFIARSFDVVFGPEVEDDDHNFRALNFSPDHPARTMHDSLYLERGLLLRTHTSSVQIRYMKEHKPPMRIIAPGRVYRRDRDLTHSPMFTQVEGLVVDKGVGLGELLAALEDLVQHIFSDTELKTRFRPSFFPFTEPSVEMDISCLKCQGSGCRVCSQSGWLEVLGCGMVHPAVLNNVGIDPDIFQGYAFGLGVERIAMLAHGISDLRLLFENHLGFLDQFQPS